MERASRGDLVELNGVPCVIVALAGELVGMDQVPEDHVALWYGNTGLTTMGEESGRVNPEVWTVPLEYVEKGQVPTLRH